MARHLTLPIGRIALIAAILCALVLTGGPDAAADHLGDGAGSSADGHAAGQRDRDLPRVTIALVPNETTLEQLARVPGVAPGLMSAGLGRVLPDQTYLDISQGARVFNSLYEGPLPLVLPRGERVPKWDEIRERAESAPGEILPGLLASTLTLDLRLRFTGPAVQMEPELVVPALIGADLRGRVARLDESCVARRCAPPVLIRDAQVGELRQLTRRLRGSDLLIAIERPQGEDDRRLALGIAGRGYRGNLTSPTTRRDGYVTSTDIAPTILERFGAEVPAQMTGSPIRSGGERSVAALTELEQRMSEVVPRRGPVLGVALLVWLALAGLAVLLPAARRHALRALALSAMLLPGALLLTAGLEPSLGVERAVALLGPPAVAALLLRFLPGWRAVAVACGATVTAHAIDLLAGSPLTALSLMGPNPGLGVRFYGIGNELGAALSVLTLIGSGAGLAGFFPRLDRRLAALAFIGVAVPVAGVFAAGRFGADVGSAIVIPASAVVAAAVVLARPLLAVAALAVPALGLAALAAIDALTGGDSHFQQSVLEAEGPGELIDTIARRLRLTGRSFVRGASGPFLPLTAVAIGLGVTFWRPIRAWVGAAPPALGAGFAAAVFATVLGTLANDSGLILLEIGTAYLLLTAGFAWAERG